MGLIFLTKIGTKSLDLLESWGYLGAFFWSALDRISISLIPTEVLLPLYGFLISRGSFSFLPLFLIISIGSLMGEIVLYWIFSKGGRPIVERYGKYFLVYKHDLEHLDRLFAKHGQRFVFWGRLFPVARAIVAIPAGISRIDFKKFAIYSFLGMLPYNFGLIFLGVETGANFERFHPYFKIAEKLVLIALGVFIAWYIYSHLRNRHLTHNS